MYIKKAVITKSYKYNGTMFDAFEYFYKLWECDNSIKLVSNFDLFNKNFLTKKYNINEKCFDNIIIGEPLNFKYDIVLLFDVYNFYNYLINAKQILVINNNSFKIKGNVEYFDEYFQFKNYTNKIYFEIHKKYEHNKNVYINALDKNNLEYLKLIKTYPNAITKDSQSNFQNYKNTKNFLPNIYELFDYYIYLKTPKTYDRHPRQFAECAWQNIECEFISIGPKDTNNCNAWKRFNDRYDFEKRNIKNDIVIDKILNY